ncbi:hypothetical protein JCGZ_23367 [Jatropha curcas]|uniref:SHSP domain-containing protein n=1 Tax=Jatropha curcas TaxID=180498 RepID=A0A067JVH1_JATCU|nr:increased DNA methylation 2 [Jatropha curcas]KDP23534.1 hypothetical protein JCGZ_23367 [Jatropha curcas]
METQVRAANPVVASGSESFSISSKMPSGNQRFLLYFIIGTYFGPDLKEERPQKSILQRIAEGLPAYTSDQLAGSHMKTVEVERVYYYALQKADKSLIVKLHQLHNFFQGTITTSKNESGAVYPQFPDIFPPLLHPQYRLNRCKIVENIVFINDPDTSYIKPEDIERFKRITGLEILLFDRDATRYKTSLDGSSLYNVAVHKGEPVGGLTPLKSSDCSQKGKCSASTMQPEDQHVHFVEPLSIVPCTTLPPEHSHTSPPPTRDDTRTMGKVSPGILFLPPFPSKEDLEKIVAAGKGGFALTGSAAMGQVGPIIGLMDIGECDDAYMFRISLPGVKRDEKEFSCGVDAGGRVLINGETTTGERTVCRFSQVFEMQSKNLCPPGKFSIAFQLPGPVDPEQFSGNFGSDGILEGIVMKR